MLATTVKPLVKLRPIYQTSTLPQRPQNPQPGKSHAYGQSGGGKFHILNLLLILKRRETTSSMSVRFRGSGATSVISDSMTGTRTLCISRYCVQEGISLKVNFRRSTCRWVKDRTTSRCLEVLGAVLSARCSGSSRGGPLGRIISTGKDQNVDERLSRWAAGSANIKHYVSVPIENVIKEKQSRKCAR